MASIDLSGRGSAVVASRMVVWVVLGMSVLFGVFVLGFGAVSIVSSAIDGRVSMVLATTNPLPGEADAGRASIVEGHYDSATVIVENLDVGTASIAIAGQAIRLLTQASLAAALALLCWSLLRAAPFRKSLSLTVTSAGAVVLIGGILVVGLSVLSAWMAAEQLNAPDAGLDGFWPLVATVDPTFLVLGVALLLVGLAFEYGERLQRDTVGLV